MTSLEQQMLRTYENQKSLRAIGPLLQRLHAPDNPPVSNY
jgi:hypothetical protein